MRSRAFACVSSASALALLFACNGAVLAVATGDDAGADGSVEAAPPPRPDGPYGIRCSVYARDLSAGETQHQSAEIALTSNVDGTATTTVHGITFEGALASIAGAPDSALLRLSVKEARVEHELRLERLRPPPYEYAGWHGFTGLVYVPVQGLDVQYICNAGSVSPGPSSKDPSRPVPLHVRCTVRHHPGADAGDTDREEVLELAGGGKDLVNFVEAAVNLIAYDDPYEGRAVLLQITPSGVLGSTSYQTQQLLQLDRWRALPNLFGPEHGITGRLKLSSADGGSISYACSSISE